MPKLGGIVGKIQNSKPGTWFEGCTSNIYISEANTTLFSDLF